MVATETFNDPAGSFVARMTQVDQAKEAKGHLWERGGVNMDKAIPFIQGYSKSQCRMKL